MTRTQASAYQGAFESVLAVPIAVGFGYWAGGLLGSSTTGIVLGAVIGFAAMVLRLTRMRPGTAEPGEPGEVGEKGEKGEPDEKGEPNETDAAVESDARQRGASAEGAPDAEEKGGPMIGFGLFGEEDEEDD